ncbi:MAG TPA: cell division protein FtsA [Anaerolineae bacterium]|nr:cell division protein FtsA [Anaerolineae bacterium]HQH38642.1 cell division protein FtsA [Anaerolineae bacterium]
MERSVVSIDIGSHRILVLVGEITEAEDVRIVGVGSVPSKGIKKGVIVNVNEATAAIAEAVERAEQSSGYQIERAYIGVAGTHISSRNSQGVVGVARRDRGITPDDVDRVLEAAGAIVLPQNQELVHIIPRSYTVDGQEGVRDPLGMHGFRLEVEAHVVIGSSTAVQNLKKCVEGAGIEVGELVLTSLAAGKSVLSATEKEMGVVLVDIGEGTTDIAIFIEGTVWHTRSLPMGGEYITNDIAIGLRLPSEVAEQVKLQYGHALAAQVAEDERFTISPYGESSPVVMPRWKLAQIIQARCEEILENVQQEIKRSGYDGLLPAGLVLCGGTAQLPGLRELARDLFGLPVQIGIPKNIAGLTDQVNNPAAAVGVGLVEWTPLWEEGGGWKTVRVPWWKRGLPWLRTLLPE